MSFVIDFCDDVGILWSACSGLRPANSERCSKWEPRRLLVEIRTEDRGTDTPCDNHPDYASRFHEMPLHVSSAKTFRASESPASPDTYTVRPAATDRSSARRSG